MMIIGSIILFNQSKINYIDSFALLATVGAAVQAQHLKACGLVETHITINIPLKFHLFSLSLAHPIT